MGKGHGAFFRWTIRLKPNVLFLEFMGFHFLLLRRVLLKSRY